MQPSHNEYEELVPCLAGGSSRNLAWCWQPLPHHIKLAVDVTEAAGISDAQGQAAHLRHQTGPLRGHSTHVH